jgi:hypothetical protein
MLQQESQVLLYLEWPALIECMILLHQWPQVDSGQQKVQAWSSEDTPTGTTSDQNVINSGMAKNKIDIQSSE